jgi:hypothetical protein
MARAVEGLAATATFERLVEDFATGSIDPYAAVDLLQLP